jgi:ABC-type transport system involved in multi-copper enzyme maturation permease subunit
MSLVRSPLAWCRQSLVWSTSEQSGRERASALGILASAGLLWLLCYWLPLTPLLFLAALWLAALVIVQRQGWLHVFGPVLFYDMIRTARRNRYGLMRSLYACFLLLLLFWVYNLVADARLDNRQHAARLAEDFFQWFMFVQLIAVVLLTPAYVGGAVAEEKERKTLEFILATDLRNQEIVLSKLGSRLANLSLFLLTGLPILSFLQFLGGIDPNLVLMGFAATGLTMLGLGSVSVMYSVRMRRPRDAISLTYLICLVYLALGTTAYGMGTYWVMQLPVWFGSDPPTLATIATLLNTGNPLLLIIQVGMAGRSGALATTLPGLLASYATFHLLLAVLCIGYSILRLRVLGLKQTVGREIKATDARGYRRPVGEWPMLWKERVEGRIRFGWTTWLGFVPLFLLTLGIGLWIVIDHIFEYHWGGRGQALAEKMNVWARMTGTSIACLTILSAAVRASTSISGERDKQTLDALITTQMTSDSILVAKLLGSLFGVRLGAIWLVSILVLACLTGGISPVAFVLVLAAWLVYACFFTMLGLWFSMICKASTRATVYTVMCTLALSVGHWLIWFCLGPLMMFARSGPDSIAESLLKFQSGMTPPFVLGVLLYRAEDLTHGAGRGSFGEMFAYSLLGLCLWSIACFPFWYGLLAPEFRTIMRRERSYRG